MQIQDVKEIIRLLDQSQNITEFTYEHEGVFVEIRKREKQTLALQNTSEQIHEANGAITTLESMRKQSLPTVSVQTKENLQKIVSPMVGTFYSSSAPDLDNYVSVGDKVSENTVVCIVEAMKLFNEIEAELNGEIVEILVKDGQLVEYGQPLFLVKER
jgi:acetyl-CoA carboxylase biotin carboxyl carrier protein